MFWPSKNLIKYKAGSGDFGSLKNIQYCGSYSKEVIDNVNVGNVIFQYRISSTGNHSTSASLQEGLRFSHSGHCAPSMYQLQLASCPTSTKAPSNNPLSFLWSNWKMERLFFNFLWQILVLLLCLPPLISTSGNLPYFKEESSHYFISKV